MDLNPKKTTFVAFQKLKNWYFKNNYFTQPLKSPQQRKPSISLSLSTKSYNYENKIEAKKISTLKLFHYCLHNK